MTHLDKEINFLAWSLRQAFIEKKGMRFSNETSFYIFFFKNYNQT